MTLSNNKKDLYRLASAYASVPHIVQGAGGNFSVKVSSEQMLVKASGKTFSDITENGEGLVSVNYPALKNYLNSATNLQDEAAHVENILKNSSGGRPSMEVWFHLLLKTYVLHTHSVYVNILACANEGSLLFSKLMQECDLQYVIVPFCAPGFELGKAMSKLNLNAPVYFLENHGVIVTGDSAEECLILHKKIEEKIRKTLTVKDELFGSIGTNEDFASFTLFPDQIIYPSHTDIRAAHAFILEHIRLNTMTPRTIPKAAALAVADMESEKYRQQLK